MAQENTVSFKVFLQKEGQSEVRRFGVDRDVVSNFSYLTEKLQTVFPNLRGQDFFVSWKDSDGDEIVISSDDELMIALTEMQTDVRKLFVTIRPGYARQQQQHHHQQSSDGRRQHFGVTCDGCQKEVDGFRYKCIQCHDFDLCAGCESKGLHSEHYMIRMPVPTFWRPHFGRRLAHHLAKAAHKGGHCGWESEPGHCSWKPHGGKHGGRHHGGPGWFETLATYLNEWTNLPGEEESQAKEESSNPSTSNQENSKQQEQQEDARVQYLRNIGQTVASVLDPLGIDVDIEVRTRNKDEKISKTGSEQKKPDDHDKKADAADEQASAMEVDDKHEKEAPTTSVRSERESPENEGWTVVNGDAPQQGDSSTPSTSVGAFRGPTEETGAVPKQPNTSAATPLNASQNNIPTSSGNVYPNLFNLPNQIPFAPMAPLHPQPSSHAVPLIPSFFNPILPAQPFMQHPPSMKPHIADSVQKMMSMGFSNDGGWLTQLLESKDGNIEKALDVLQPVKKP